MNNISSILSKLPTVVKKETNIGNLFIDFQIENKFNSNTYQDVLDTFDYIYRRYGKAIYIKIINNKVENFIPFKNINYKNIWQKKYIEEFSEGDIIINEDIIGLLDGYVVLDYNKDKDVNWIKNFIDNLCLKREISDCEFFINNEKNLPLISNNCRFADLGFEKYICDPFLNPRQHCVFSFNTSENFKDIGFPMISDFERLNKNTFGINDFKSMKWDDKITEFFFRSSSINNQGVFENKEPLNQKLNLLNQINNFDEEIKKLFNAGINEFKSNNIIYKNKVYLIEKKEKYLKLEFKEDNLISKYKFIIIADTVGCEQEFSNLLFTGSCILKIKSDWCCWFENLLKPDVHYKVVSKDLSDFKSVINWCINNEESCKNIGLNAREFAIKYLSTNGIFDYMQKTLNDIKQVKYKVNFEIIQAEFQKNYIIQYFDIEFNDHKYNNDKFNYQDLENKIRLASSENRALTMICSSYGFTNMKFLYSKEYKNFIEGVNDAFIGLKCINNLCSEIPNFVYTVFCKTENNNLLVLTEKLNNVNTLDIFLQNYPTEKINVFVQLFMALQMAYERFHFIHGNLEPKHILVQTLPKPQKIIYRLLDKTWALNTRYILIITNYSKSIVLSNFDYYYKHSRMFIGNINTNFEDNENIEEKMLHSKTKHKNLKTLFKKVSLKMYENVINVPLEDKPPLNIMKKVISNEDIKNSNLKFGGYSETLEDCEIENPRLVYDKITNQDDPHEKVYQRIFKNPLPVEKTAEENIILQYEILQSIKSAILDLNFKVSIDLITSERLKHCYNFVKSYYNEIIERNINNEEFINTNTNEFYGIKIIIKKYLVYMLYMFSNQKFRNQIALILATTLKDTISIGIKNTLKFYEQFNKIN